MEEKFQTKRIVRPGSQARNITAHQTTTRPPANERIIVFHGGFSDPSSRYPQKLAQAWEKNGVSRSRLYIMPNGYVGSGSLIESIKSYRSDPLEKQTFWVRCKNFITGLANAVSDTVINLLKFTAYCDARSTEINEKIKCLNNEMLRRGYTPEKPAEVSFVAHSGGVAPVSAILRATKNSTERFAFKPAEITTFGSPQTMATLDNIPKDIETNFIVSQQDSVYSTVVNWLGYITPAFTGLGYRRSEVSIVSDPKRYLNTHTAPIEVKEIEKGGHSGYHLDSELMKNIVADSLTAQY